jgi:hypothetical protein
VFCLVLLGSMLGPRSAPGRVPRLELEGLLRLMTADESALVHSRYILDENQLDSEGSPTPEYVLIQTAESGPSEDSGGQPKLAAVKGFSEQHQNEASDLEHVLRTAARKCWRESSASELHDPTRCVPYLTPPLCSLNVTTAFSASIQSKHTLRLSLKMSSAAVSVLLRTDTGSVICFSADSV